MTVSRKRLLVLGLALFLVGMVLANCGGFVVGTIYLWPHVSASSDSLEQNEEELRKDVGESFSITMVLVALGTIVALAGLLLTIGAAISSLLSRSRRNGHPTERLPGE